MELGYSRGGAEFLFSQASVADDHPTVVEVAGDLRNFVEPGSTEDVWLVEQRAGALLASGDPEAALEYLRTISEAWLIPQKRWVQVVVGAGKYEEALAVADSAAPVLDGLQPEKLMLRAMVYTHQPYEQALKDTLVEIGQHSGMNRDLWIFSIEALAIAGMVEEAQTWIDDYFSRFAAQAGAIESLLQRVAISENREVMRYVTERIAEWRKPNPNLRLPLAAVLIQAGDWDGLSNDFADVLKDDGALSDGLFVWVRAVVEAVQSPGSADQLDVFLAQGSLRLLFYRTMADGFAKTEQWELVKRVVNAGMRHHPHSAGLMRRGEEASQHLANRVEDTRVDDALAATGFNYAADDVPALRLQFRRRVESAEWDHLESESLRIRLQQPAWLSEIEATLDWAEAHAAAARHDFERLRIVAPRVLRDDGEMAAWFTDQAELAIEAGSTESAIRLLEVILAEEKFHHRVRTILKELTRVVEPEDAAPPAEPSE
jgi:hypothetical protein